MKKSIVKMHKLFTPRELIFMQIDETPGQKFCHELNVEKDDYSSSPSVSKRTSVSS